MQDLMNNINVLTAIAPASVSDTTPKVGAIIDRQGYESVTYAVAIGSVADADATFTVLLEDGDDASLSDAAAVADSVLLGTEALAGFQFDDDNLTRKLGYVGGKRYSRLTITPVANASAAVFGVTVVLGHPNLAPTSNPSV
jgi:hypothetical protein